MEWYLNNREIIRNIAFNTGTDLSPAWTVICTTSEVNIDTDFEEKDFYVFCDAIKRSVVTGAKLVLNTTVKLDINNTAIQNLIGKIHTLITSGTVAQFNNEEIEFELLETVSSNVLTYKKYKVPVVLKFSDLGGGAEDEGDFGLEISLNGKGTVVTP